MKKSTYLLLLLLLNACQQNSTQLFKGKEPETGPENMLEHPGGLHLQQQIEHTKQQIEEKAQPWIAAYDSLLIQAKENIKRPPEAIADFNVPGYYKDAKGHRSMMGRLSKDAWGAYSCALAYQLTSGKERFQYADKAIQVLMNWAEVNTQTSNYDGDLAMADAGVGLIFAAELMTSYKGWEEEQRSAFKKWLQTVYFKSCTKIAKEKNNWGDWGTLGCLASYHFLDDKGAIENFIPLIKDKIDHSIAADGSMPDETKRGKRGLWYSYFALAPLTASCQIVQNTCAIDLFNYKGEDGAGIEEALDYLLRYEQNPENWPHYKEKDLRKGRPDLYPGNLYEAMYGIYGKATYNEWIRDARPIMVYGHHYAWAVPTLLPPMPPANKRKFDKSE